MTHISMPGWPHNSGSTVQFHQSLLQGPLPGCLLLNCLVLMPSKDTATLTKEVLLFFIMPDYLQLCTNIAGVIMGYRIGLQQVISVHM